jgi:DNA polymerase-3 subunit beta
MRFSVLQENLAAAIKDVKRAVESRPQLPILSNIAIVAEGSFIKLMATDLQMSIVRTIGGKIDVPGAITLPCDLLEEVVNNLSKERIDFDLNAKTQTVKLHCGAANSRIKGITFDEFPPITDKSTHAFHVSGEQLARAITEVVFSAATNDSRPILTGINVRVDVENEKVWLATADGYRLSITFIDLLTPPSSDDKTLEFTIPAAAMKELAAMLKKAEPEMVRVGYDTSARNAAVFFSFEHGNEVFIQALEGKYPDFTAVVPQKWEVQATAYVEDLEKANKRAKIFARDNADSTYIAFQPPKTFGDAGQVNLAGLSAERGDINVALNAGIEGHKVIATAFKNSYLSDALKTVDVERAVIETMGYEYPIVVHAQGSEYPKHVIMPISGSSSEEELLRVFDINVPEEVETVG